MKTYVTLYLVHCNINSIKLCANVRGGWKPPRTM